MEILLQLNNILDGFWNGRRFEPLFKGRVIGLMEFSDLAGNSDDKREGPFEEEDNGGHSCPVTNLRSAKCIMFMCF